MARMGKQEAELLCEQIRRFHAGNESGVQKSAWEHFKPLGYSKSTVHEMEQITKRKKQSGRPVSVATPRKMETIENLYEKSPNLSNSRGAAKIKIPISSFRDI